jgi:rhamnogalacturonan acetylesterase
MMRYTFLLISFFVLTSGTAGDKKAKPVIYIIGDSTVKCGRVSGEGGLWGWGDYLYQRIDTNKISIRNFAIGGLSSRTYISGGYWDIVLSKLKKGDYVIMQFGHNDGGPAELFNARGTINGSGDETKEVDNKFTGKHEIVHTFGWYMKKYAADTKAKGATPVICSLIPRNNWENGKVKRNSEDYAKWAKEAAEAEKAYYIDLNEIIAKKYEAIGEDTVKTKFFPRNEHTHTNLDGAILNAGAVAYGIKSLKGCILNKYLIKEKENR